MSALPDVRVDGLSSGGAVSLSWPHNMGPNATLLVVDSNQSDGTIAGHGTTGVQWDSLGTPAALIRKARIGDSSGFAQADAWYLDAPSPGNKQITITNDSSSIAVQGGSASYKGTDHTTPFTAASPLTSTGTGPGTQPSRTVAVDVSDMLHDTLVTNNSPETLVPASGQATISNDTVGSGIHTGASSDKPGSGGATTMAWSGTSTTWAYIVLVIKGAVSPAPGPVLTAQQRRG